MCFEVCTTNFGNLNRPHFSSLIFTNKIANRAKMPDILNFFKLSGTLIC